MIHLTPPILFTLYFLLRTVNMCFSVAERHDTGFTNIQNTDKVMSKRGPEARQLSEGQKRTSKPGQQ